MHSRRLWIFCPCFLFAGSLLGDDTVRAKLIGTWRDAAAAGSTAGAVWSLEDKGDDIRITHVVDGQKVEDVACNTMGRECEVKDSGKHVKISMWFNGQKLVQMVTRGSEVTKRRFSIVENGDMMEVEVIPIVPGGQTQVVQLRRVVDTAAPK
jgi:hypothetical protein